MKEITILRIGTIGPANAGQIYPMMERLRKKHPTLDLRIRGTLRSSRVVGTPKFVLPIKV